MNFLETTDFEEFKGVYYGGARRALLEEPDHFLLNLLSDCISNQEYMNFIKLSNLIHEIPPVESFIKLYSTQISEHQRKINSSDDERINDPQLRKAIRECFSVLYFKVLNLKINQNIKGIKCKRQE